MLCIFSCIYAVVDLCTCSFLLEELYYSFTLEFTDMVFFNVLCDYVNCDLI